jgi:HK97 family phage major capsid protein
MTAQDFSTWIAEEKGSDVLQAIMFNSVMERVGSHVPMRTNKFDVPRDGGVTVGVVAKSASYSESAATNDDIVLTAMKFGSAVRIAEEDIQDTSIDILTIKKTAWARQYAKMFDNATLGTTAVVGTGVPFTSLYLSLKSTDSNAGYTANANYTSGAASAFPAGGYTLVSNVMGLVEQGNFFDDGQMCWMAHPAFKAYLRNVQGLTYNGATSGTTTNNTPVFVDGREGTNIPPTLLGYPVYWTQGAKTSATALAAPGGNPLLFFGNKDYVIVGDRSPVQSMVAGADSGPAFLTDEALLKVRTRKGFGVGFPQAWSVLELI